LRKAKSVHSGCRGILCYLFWHQWTTKKKKDLKMEKWP